MSLTTNIDKCIIQMCKIKEMMMNDCIKRSDLDKMRYLVKIVYILQEILSQNEISSDVLCVLNKLVVKETCEEKINVCSYIKKSYNYSNALKKCNEYKIIRQRNK